MLSLVLEIRLPFALMNDFLVIGNLCYAQSILGSPGGKHFKSPERNVQCTESCVFIKGIDVGQRIAHFCGDFVRHRGDKCLYMEIEGFCLINATKYID